MSALERDPLMVWSERKQRYYRRKFDHDEARSLYAAGISIRRLAGRFGVAEHAVRIACIPDARARAREATRRSIASTCEGCGGPATKRPGPDGRVLCPRCRADAKRERLLFNADGVLIAVRCVMLDCANGERWQAPENFPHGPRHREIREGGIHSQCRACGTRSRQAYREAKKVPCVGCGTLCLPPSEKTTTGADVPRCRDCFVDSRRKPEAVTSEAMPTREGA